jgi:hypothetical protein
LWRTILRRRAVPSRKIGGFPAALPRAFLDKDWRPIAPRVDDNYDLIDAEPAELRMFGIIESRRQGDLIGAEDMSIFSPSPTMNEARLMDGARAVCGRRSQGIAGRQRLAAHVGRDRSIRRLTCAVS